MNPQALGGIARDVSGLLGAASISFGAWMIYHPAGFIVGGMLLVAGSLLASRQTP